MSKSQFICILVNLYLILKYNTSSICRDARLARNITFVYSVGPPEKSKVLNSKGMQRTWHVSWHRLAIVFRGSLANLLYFCNLRECWGILGKK
jgi:hypothetical protein